MACGGKKGGKKSSKSGKKSKGGLVISKLLFLQG